MAIFYNPKVITDGLVLCLDAANPKSYPGSGTTWTDLSGRGNNGTLTNGPTYNSSNSGSIVFDGVDDYVSIPFSGNIYCMDFWISPATTLSYTSTQVFLLDFNNGQQSVAFGSCTGIIANELITVLTNSNPAGSRSSYVSTTDNISSWTNIIANWNGTDYIFTINGNTKTTSGGGVAREIINAISPVKLGFSDGEGIGGKFNGKVSNLKLYNRALTEAEIQQNYNALRSRYQ